MEAEQLLSQDKHYSQEKLQYLLQNMPDGYSFPSDIAAHLPHSL